MGHAVGAGALRGHRRRCRGDLRSDLGLVGPAARACGVERDVRHEFPSGIYRFAQIPVSTWHSGDVFARAYVRWLEIQRSVAFVREQLAALPDGPVRVDGRTAGGRTDSSCRWSKAGAARSATSP